MTDMALRRFHAALIDAMEERGLDLTRPFTVAEIYQDLVPYRTHRDVLGVEINGDYEHLLLRLLAGEEGLVRIESNAALERITDELEASNPNTGIFRDFAAVDVRLFAADDDSARIPAVQLHTEDSTDSKVDPIDDEPMEIGAFAPSPAVQPQLQVEMDGGQAVPMVAQKQRVSTPAPQEPTVAAVDHIDDSDEDQSGEDEPCRWCRQLLPHRENLNFCPFCGENTSIVPCGSCDEPLEPEWRFCISCGTEVPTG